MRPLTTLPLKELKTLSERIRKEIGARTNRAKLEKALATTAKANGSSLDAVAAKQTTAKTSSRPAARKPVPVKYMHPSNRKLAWSGRGSRPAWVKVWQERGGSLDGLAIAAQKLGQGPSGA